MDKRVPQIRLHVNHLQIAIYVIKLKIQIIIILVNGIQLNVINLYYIIYHVPNMQMNILVFIDLMDASGMELMLMLMTLKQ